MTAVRRQIRKAQKQRGEFTEDRFFSAFEFPTEDENDIPLWMCGVPQRATEAQDKYEGIDVVVLSDIGEIYLNIKSSKRGAQGFARHQRELGRRKPVFAIVVRPEESPRQIRKNAYRVAKKARKNILKSR